MEKQLEALRESDRSRIQLLDAAVAEACERKHGECSREVAALKAASLDEVRRVRAEADARVEAALTLHKVSGK